MPFRIASIIAVLSLFLSFFVLPVRAGECGADPVYSRNIGGTVTTGARVRDIACMEGSIVLTTLAVGTKVTIIGETEGWWKVRTASGLEGWVGQWLIAAGGDPLPSNGGATAVSTPPAIGLVKGLASSAVYFVKDGKRYAFPNERIFKSWYADFGSVVTLTDSALASLQLTSSVTYRPGMRLVKIQTDPKVYAVSRYGVLRWIMSEEAAALLYGVDWSKKVDDLSDAFFAGYLLGSPIASASDYDPASEQAAAATPGEDIRPVGYSLP